MQLVSCSCPPKLLRGKALHAKLYRVITSHMRERYIQFKPKPT